MFHFRNSVSAEERFIKKARKYDPFEVKAYEEFALQLQENARAVTQKRLGIKLLLVSDTHREIAFHRSDFEAFLKINHEYDLCVLLGDIHPVELDIILELIPISKIIAVKGNHDAFDQYRFRGIVEISGSTYTYNGITIAGIEGSFKYKQEDFPAFTQYESLILAKQMVCGAAKDADILISHDSMFSTAMKNHAHVGLVGIAYYIYNSNCQWHFHGHVHQSYTKEYKNGTREKSVYLYEYTEV